MAQQSISDLVSKMNGVRSTNKWDVVVSYSVKELNDFLKAAYAEDKLVSSVTLASENAVYDIRTKKYWVDTYKINFKTPTLDFVLGQRGMARLVMPIGDGSSLVSQPYADKELKNPGEAVKSDLPGGGKYSVVAMVPLAVISGNKKVADQGNVVKFEGTTPSDYHIALHFKNLDGTAFQVTPEPTDDDPDMSSVIPMLVKHFQTKVSEVSYVLTGVNNRKPAEGNVLLTPKSFAFASTGDKDAGCLSLFINVDQSGNDPGNPAPSFQPGDQQVSPIPSGYTASIILSDDLMAKTFIKKRLEQAGFDVTVKDQTTGSLFSLKRNVSVIAQGKETGGKFKLSNFSYGGLTVSMQTYPLELSVADGKVSTRWSGSTQSSWDLDIVSGDVEVYQWGKVNIDLTMKKGPLAIRVDDDSINFPEFTFEQGDFSRTVSGVGCSGTDRMNGCVSNPPAFYTNTMKLEIPQVSFALKGLDYFLTTNLLEPSKKMIEVNATAGVSTPRDYLIVGKVAAH
ncbi:hypothetical protein ACIQ6V_27860 [Streptomyces sp. NPDC096198]|uniref:hypothetical protein n=1 Tax=Streptomyces sp. NPDC096198 TaxID=3366080 RepID=UPI0037F62668